MDTKIHFLVSLLITVILFPFFGFWSVLALLGGWLIDVDHWWGYALKSHDWNPFKMWQYFQNCDCSQFKNGKFGFLVIFHSLEFLLVCIVLSFFFPLLWILVGSWCVHMLMDLYYEQKIKIHKTYSIILFYIDNT